MSVAEIFAMPVLVAAQLQAALLLFIVLILFIHHTFAGEIFCDTLPDIVFVRLYLLIDTSIS